MFSESVLTLFVCINGIFLIADPVLVGTLLKHHLGEKA